ncbi:cytochrome c oxidase subunit I [Desulfobaculum bizertense]|uniref:cytochrome c oxidase subunit I n=1 Tax=Desulfobaculum bizertense TaxID=376490 RepID=UPI001F4449B8|nr:cytochrome c oxidase subunit I [Desulfobaculum bizertense]UIJ37745.1 cytochrome c oxidase subunit I [Desulfobaculum bizertense]
MSESFTARVPGQSLLRSWLLTTDHKRIGVMYLWGVLIMFVLGLCIGLLMRLELIAPGATLMDAQTYNAMFTVHGVVMIFLVIIPSIPASFGNIMLPLHIGAEDVAFPRVNCLSWWMYMIGGLMALGSLFTGGGAPDTGWTFYVPFSTKTGTNVGLAVSAAFVLGFSSILTGLNFIVTVHRLRAPKMTWGKLPLFVWSLYSTAWIQVLATPILGITLLLIVAERVLGLGIFDPARGGDPILYQHLFWIYSHPAVYIMILPAMGTISEIIPVFSRKRIFGYTMLALTSLLIAFVGSLVWAHHMFTSGMSDTAVLVFSFLTFVVAIPSAIKVFNWVTTLYKGSIRLETPMIFALGFIVLFLVGGLTGLVLGAAGTDIHVHDTYFVVGHFHYIIFGGTMLSLFAGLHYWFPKLCGRLYNSKWANVSTVLLVLGINILYMPMLVLGMKGMPRRYYDYLPQYTTLHVIVTVGSWVVAAAVLLMLGNLLVGMLRGRKAGANPWGAGTLEWTLPSPLPRHNFETPPDSVRWPYAYTEVTPDDAP